jgi:hypothetical protein
MLSPALRMTMKQKFAIGTIPAIIWGEISDNVYLFVHGKKSRKEEAEGFAGVAVRKGYQVLSFDLPEHGDRLNSNYPCTVQNGVQDLCLVEDYAKDSWKHISLFACSLGVYFSLVAYQEIRLETCLFLSPILDMEHLIRNMMKWFNVSAELLEEKREIPTPVEETLSWPYYTYVREHPIIKWENHTYILYGSNDNVTEKHVVDSFVTKFHCNLEVLENGEHYFHTTEQIGVLDGWLDRNL